MKTNLDNAIEIVKAAETIMPDLPKELAVLLLRQAAMLDNYAGETRGDQTLH